ncbi:MAG: hypothetical protein ACD_83C00016G0004 [uncultured bacterium]|uniref:Lipoprotein signal peptidase n=1 Tax=Berkelbacteria bacterium GW2011_GWA2_38_9 TaxID=1618334 RepID=A0A0G0LH00_9BACT|nr:MAG: hypothetical protein ACD_83C00016G0004 [uncultured bacterium]KKQ87195.1 MAG: Lipoprotein signal peptidase [Berkelbacteria bacterium GW2011_GWA2_38_9]
MIAKYLLIALGWLVILIYLVLNNKKVVTSIRWPLFLILAGTLANGLEVVTRGQVFDYIDLTKIGIPWPIFNVADVAIVVGLFWLIYLFFTSIGKR